MHKNLVIVESPAKAKTIEKFLGQDFKVMSSYGHIRDLKKKGLGIDLEHNFKPEYIISEDKEKLVKELKSESKKADMVWLASDEDREGEAISWHLSEVLGLKKENTKRIVFHEITKNAILHAIENPRDIDINLVNAQQARRVLDRIVGFELSPILWKKIKMGLSAGRVQSVAVRLIVEREREINHFVSEASYRVIANFILPDGATVLKAELTKRLKTKEEALNLLEACKAAAFEIDDISKKPVKKSPAAPFTTSTLQQEAARKLGYSVSQTMMIAQRLYESGLITYMRTDSVNLSDLALNSAKKLIVETYGKEYHKTRKYHTKSKGAQEAHEAIRPTYIENEQITGSAQEKKLYDLIRKRTIASQMADAELERTTISVSISDSSFRFAAVGEVLKFPGFLNVYRESTDDDSEGDGENGLLPPVSIHDKLALKDMNATERFTQRPPRYTEASLVRRLEELGIGRPSTYAPTIQTIQNREYVIKGDKEGTDREYTVLTLKANKVKETLKTETVGADKGKLMPTDIGMVVNDYLTEVFPNILEYNFTASVEKEFDTIADGELEWTDAIAKFYNVFHPMVKEAEALKTEYRVGERELGIDPESGKPVFVKIGRFGPVVQIGVAAPPKEKESKEAKAAKAKLSKEEKAALKAEEKARKEKEKEDKPKFATLLKGQSIETITLEEALKLFDLPRTVGEFEGKVVVAAIGRFGPFIRHDAKFVSIPKGYDPLSITLDEAIALIEAKRKADSEKFIKSFEEDSELQILNGRFGPYISYQKKNFKIPKDTEPASLSLEDCMKIVNEPAKPAARKRAATKKKA